MIDNAKYDRTCQKILASNAGKCLKWSNARRGLKMLETFGKKHILENPSFLIRSINLVPQKGKQTLQMFVFVKYKFFPFVMTEKKEK